MNFYLTHVMCCTLYICITIIFFTYFWLKDYHVKHLLLIKLLSYSQWSDYSQCTVKASPIYTKYYYKISLLFVDLLEFT